MSICSITHGSPSLSFVIKHSKLAIIHGNFTPSAKSKGLFNYFCWDPEEPEFPLGPDDGVLAEVFGAPDPEDPEGCPVVVLVPLASETSISSAFLQLNCRYTKS